jgi:hypothetical protein
MTTETEFLNKFKWESVDQRKGVLNFLQWFHNLPPELQGDVAPLSPQAVAIAAYFIQKDHESNLWWNDTVSGQVRLLQDQIKIIYDRLQALERCVFNERS